MKKLNFNTVFSEKFDSYFLTVFLLVFMRVFWKYLTRWYRVLIRERLPRDLTLIVGEMDTIGFYIQLILFIWFTTKVINSCYKLYRGIEKPLRAFKFTNFSGTLFIWRIFVHFSSEKFAQKIMNWIQNVFQPIVLKIYSIQDPLDIELYQNEVQESYQYKYIRRILYTWIILGHLLRILAFSILFYEITVQKYINFFYIIAPILLIPFIIRRIILIIYDTYTCMVPAKFIIITIIQEEHINLFFVAQKFLGVDAWFRKYVNIPVNILLSLSFGFLLLIRLGVY